MLNWVNFHFMKVITEGKSSHYDDCLMMWMVKSFILKDYIGGDSMFLLFLYVSIFAIFYKITFVLLYY